MRSFDPARLKALRHQAGLTQAEVAAKAGLARTNYVAIETGRLGLGVRVLPKIAKAIGCKPRDLFAGQAVTLRDLRESSGVAQAEAAHALGYTSRASYARIEQGLASPPKDAAKTLAELFDTSEARIKSAFTNT